MLRNLASIHSGKVSIFPCHLGIEGRCPSLGLIRKLGFGSEAKAPQDGFRIGSASKLQNTYSNLLMIRLACIPPNPLERVSTCLMVAFVHLLVLLRSEYNSVS